MDTVLDPQLDEASKARSRARRQQRWRLRSMVARAGDRMAFAAGGWDAVPFARQAACGRMVLDDVVEIRSKDGVAYPTGVSTCGSVWGCAVCEAKIRTGRDVEIREVAAAHAERGGTVDLMTITVRHTPGHSLAELMDAEASAWRSLQQDARWRTMREFGLVGSIRSWEVTQGFTVDQAGGSWHPHLHIVFLWEDGEHHHYETAWIAEAWAERIERRLGIRPNDHGFDYRTIPVDDVQYVNKISDELTRADLKGGSRSVWALVEAAGEGYAWAANRWAEYVAATRGRRAIQFSRGLRAHYGLDEERSDDELAAQDVDGDVVMKLNKSEYRWYLQAGYGETPRLVALLELIEEDATNAHNLRYVKLIQNPSGWSGNRQGPEGIRVWATRHAGMAALRIDSC